MVAIEATNRGVADMPWVMLTTSPAVPEIDVEKLEERLSEVTVLDVREPEEYAHGHLPGSVNLPQAELATRLDVVPHGPLAVICQAGYRSKRAAQFLEQQGMRGVFTVAGGTDAWQAAGKALQYGNVEGKRPKIVETEWAHAGASATTVTNS
ncbi:MAG: hypothetical protein PVSMB4_19380 [Ktedonobacterales bacterium]